ncbi:MAG: hypothetical protein WC314_09080 [Vulcanimicrobiota bacterium]
MKRLVLLLVLLLVGGAGACPFCDPGESDVFSDISDATAVVLVDKLEVRKYKVMETLMGPVKTGRVVVAAEPQGTLGKTGHLLLTTAGPPNLPYWSDAPRALTDTELKFARQALALRNAPNARKWDFATEHLEHPSAEISSAAYNLLATAPLSEVQSRGAKRWPNLLSWAKSSKVDPQRRALYLLMGYPRYGTAEASWVGDLLFSPNLSPSSPMLGPLAMTYLHLKGMDGLQQVRRTFYQPTLPASRVTPLNRALTLVYEQSGNGALKESIKTLFLQELDHTQRGAFVLAPLAMWQDFSGAGKAEALFSKNQNVTWVKVAVIRFFRSFQGEASKAALARLAKLDPSLVQRTTDGYRRDDLGID